MKLRWYVWVAALLAACGGDGETTTSPPPTTDERPLRQIVQERGLRIGVGTAVGSLFGTTDAVGNQYMSTLIREFDVVTAENDMKFSLLQPIRGTFRFGRADSIVALATLRSMRVRGHTLMWHNQLPQWLTAGSWTRDEASALLEDHIQHVVSHYRGALAAWDVLNEAFTDAPVVLRPGFWTDHLGRGYIEQAFRAARAADPAVPLFYNDYNIETPGAKADSVYELLAGLRSRGVPVDGVGMQMHLVAGALPIAAMQQNFARFAALGLKIHITELDVRVPTPASSASLATQAQNYREIFQLCLDTPACEMVVMWGFTDRLSWIPSVFPGQGEALIFDANLGKKPAYYAVQSVLAGR